MTALSLSFLCSGIATAHPTLESQNRVHRLKHSNCSVTVGKLESYDCVYQRRLYRPWESTEYVGLEHTAICGCNQTTAGVGRREKGQGAWPAVTSHPSPTAGARSQSELAVLPGSPGERPSPKEDSKAEGLGASLCLFGTKKGTFSP